MSWCYPPNKADDSSGALNPLQGLRSALTINQITPDGFTVITAAKMGQMTQGRLINEPDIVVWQLHPETKLHPSLW